MTEAARAPWGSVVNEHCLLIVNSSMRYHGFINCMFGKSKALLHYSRYHAVFYLFLFITICTTMLKQPHCSLPPSQASSPPHSAALSQPQTHSPRQPRPTLWWTHGRFQNPPGPS